jgi:TolA-binding protein
MDKTLGKEYAISQREAFLRDNCDSVVKKGYMKQFSQDQIQQKKEELSETDIQINDIDDEKRELNKEIRSRLDPLKDQRKTLLKDIKQKSEYIEEECFKYVDPEEKMVGFYNSEGDLIESRPATSDELQGTIFQISRKNGTNN